MSQQNGHPKGLYLLFATEMAERFSYYGMRALFTLYMCAALFTTTDAFQIYGSYTGLVYLTPLIGGYIADRYWGNNKSIITGGIIMAIGQFLMFASACFVKQSIFQEGGAIDASVDNFMAKMLMFSGLAALIIGNGFFKPNISTMVGDLYEPTDHRKDAAFTIFYMGINVGALIAPFVCGGAGTGTWDNPTHFKWAFLCAGIAMVFSVVIFWTLKKKYLRTPEGILIGDKPKSELVKEEAASRGEEIKEEAPKVKNSPLRLIGCLLLAIILIAAFGYNSESFNDWISAAVFALAIAMPVFIITDKSLTKEEMSRIGVIYIIAVFVIFFWSAFEQAGASLTYFAEHNVNRDLFGEKDFFKTPWFQSVNPICVVCFAPLFAMMWEKLGKMGKEPASPMKQALGLALLSIGYAVIAYATYGVTGNAKVSMFWLIALYAIHTCGELSLSPIGLSMVNKLSPARLASLLMGVWFMSNAASNILAGKFATLFPEPGKPAGSLFGWQVETLTDFFLIFVVMSGVASVVLFCMCPLLKRMMKGIE